MTSKHKSEPTPYKANDLFRRIASRTAHGVGSPWAFVVALAIVLIWGVTGPLFGFTDTWQLVINTGTTIVTFLMVFLIQNTQNRDSHAIHLKLDELIRANRFARNRLMAAEELTDEDLDELQTEFDRMAREKIASRSQRTPKKVANGHPTSNGTSHARHPSAGGGRASRRAGSVTPPDSGRG